MVWVTSGKKPTLRNGIADELNLLLQFYEYGLL